MDSWTGQFNVTRTLLSRAFRPAGSDENVTIQSHSFASSSWKIAAAIAYNRTLEMTSLRFKKATVIAGASRGMRSLCCEILVLILSVMAMRRD
jgi:hypothetical protein